MQAISLSLTLGKEGLGFLVVALIRPINFYYDFFLHLVNVTINTLSNIDKPAPYITPFRESISLHATFTIIA